MINFLVDLTIFGTTVKLSVILYIFTGAAILSFLIYILNFVFSKNKYKSSVKKKSQYQNLKNQEILKENIDTEVASIVKNRKDKE